MSDDETVDACFVKFKNIANLVSNPIGIQLPYVFDDDHEVVLKRSTAEFEVLKKLFLKFLPKFNFNLYVNPVPIKQKNSIIHSIITNLNEFIGK